MKGQWDAGEGEVETGQGTWPRIYVRACGKE